MPERRAQRSRRANPALTPGQAGGAAGAVVEGAVVEGALTGGLRGGITYGPPGGGSGGARLSPASNPRRASRLSASAMGWMGAGLSKSVTGTSFTACDMKAAHVQAGIVPPCTCETPLMPSSGRRPSE